MILKKGTVIWVRLYNYIYPVFSTTCRTSNCIDPEGRQSPYYFIRKVQEVSVVLVRPAEV